METPGAEAPTSSAEEGASRVEGAEGVQCGKGCPIPHWGEESEEGLFELKKASFDA